MMDVDEEACSTTLLGGDVRDYWKQRDTNCMVGHRVHVFYTLGILAAAILGFCIGGGVVNIDKEDAMHTAQYCKLKTTY